MTETTDGSDRVRALVRADRLSSAAIVVIGLLVIGLFVQQQVLLTGSASGFPLDDAYIHLQFAKNLAAGNGLAFMPERPVPGSTSPLWTALLAPAFIFGSDTAVLWSKVLGIVLFLVAAVDLCGFARDLGLRVSLCALAGVLLVLTETLAFSALSGMEVSLFIALLVRGMRCLAREHARGERRLATPGMWLLVVAALARPEALLLVGLAVAERLWMGFTRLRTAGRTTDRSWLARSWLDGGWMALVILLPTGLLFWFWSGSPLPTTFSIKAGSSHQWLPAVRDLWRFGEVMFRVQPLMVVLVASGAMWLVKRRATLTPALWVFGLPLAYSALNASGQPVLLGNFGRYGFPLLPFVVLLGCCGLEELMSAFERRGGTRRRWLLAAAVTVALISPASGLTNGAGRAAWAVHNVEQSDVAAARFVDLHLAGAKIGAQDIGALGFFSDNAVLDLVGLVNPEIVPYARGSSRGSHPSGLEGLFRFSAEEEVDYLLLFPRSYGGMQNLLSMRPGLKVVQQWKIERNVAMAGSELVLLEF